MAGESGWGALGEMLGGSGHATYEKAYNEGRYRSAQTEDALMQARINQAKAVDQELSTKQKTELLANPANLMNPDPNTLANLLVGGLGSDYNQASTGMKTQQGIRLTDQVANVGTPAEQRLRDLQALEGKPSADLVNVGANDYVNLADDLQVPDVLPSAEAEIAAKAANEGSTPAIKNFEYGNALPPEQRAGFTPYVRNDVVVQAGGVPVNTGFGGKAPAAAVVDPNTVARNAGTVAQGKAEGSARGAQVAALPGKEEKVATFLADIDAFLADPGFTEVYGKSGSAYELAGRLAPASYQQAKGRLNTLDAQTFGLAIEQMKGLGALSNAEGQKVQAAYTRATNPLIDEDDARVAWEEVKNRLDRAQQKASGLKQSAILPPAATSGEDFSALSDEQLLQMLNQ